MQLHCLGTTGYHPSEQRHTSCYFLPADGIVLDAGSGLFRLAPYVETDHLEIVLSHAHLDHVLGLTFLLDVVFERPVSRIDVWGEAAKLEAVKNHLFNELIFPAKIPVSWNSIEDQESFRLGKDGRVVVDWRAQEHPGGSVGFRFRWSNPGKTLVYATDTVGDVSQESLDWMRGADLLMHECYFRDSARQWALKTGHCWTSRVAEIAGGAAVKKLLMTHINPLENGEDPVELETAKAVFPNTLVAEDWAIIDF